ncbi:hypothetical protein D1BOALGB6SA_1310 [Olavius sp. associated proteobacterium Delta 1]|nr:hypothetical protein D1BOALGB6SA_1310 [Olavius sp. associated proteobacterium Delta 1]
MNTNFHEIYFRLKIKCISIFQEFVVIRVNSWLKFSLKETI